MATNPVIEKEIDRNLSRLENMLTEKAKEALASACSEDVARFDAGIGTMIRLKLLRPKGALYKSFIREGYSDIIQMSMAVLTKLHRCLQSTKNCSVSPSAEDGEDQQGIML